MNNFQEERSLLEVREWKEQCRLQDDGLPVSRYLEKVHVIAEEMKARYHIRLPKISTINGQNHPSGMPEIVID